MAALQTEVTKPIVIWLTEPGSPYTPQVVSRVVEIVESWIVRRRLLRLQSSDQGRIAADLIDTARGSGDDDVVRVVTGYLTGLQYASTYWPGDAEITAALASEAFYRRFSQPVQRMLLQAIEDWYRGYTSGAASKTGIRVSRDKQQIEHILPRGWRAHWSVEGTAQEADRDEHVHRLGNLTLLTGALNSAVSNSEWLGAKGKRAALSRHDVLLINREITRDEVEWNEARIDQRTAELTQALLATWPVPEGHQGKVVDKGRFSKATTSYADLIAAGLLTVGTLLECADPRWPEARCEVLAGGRVLYEGEALSSPSAAGKKVRGGAVNAWYFWRVEGGPLLNTLRERLLGEVVDE
jgi:hypothetical protein